MIPVIVISTVKLPAKHICIILLLLIFCLFCRSCFLSRPLTAQAPLPLSGMVIGVDPGHGGYDPGVIKGDIKEKDIVLAIGLFLRNYLQQGGAWVVMTRDRDMDFLEAVAGPKKRLDMQNRLRIIEEAGVELLISIHTNGMNSSLWRGAQVFYQQGSEEGKLLAGAIQDELRRVAKNTDRQIKGGDFFMLREASMNGALVEVGFLSNPEEAALLATPEYQKKIAWAIYLGIISYLSAR
ncbi:MAG TPA: N-acetylmuramoyl-L-alanine amidase CwlD [Firmicutes bacterium]|nr:N-acetylmuramoyl-L-alanine amidase CwlD [Bacillota bacterium]HAA34591.1 N-acetylmuramoyl-L-alanine amidase CwlD [Bacillota bacterium]